MHLNYKPARELRAGSKELLVQKQLRRIECPS